MAIGQHVFSKLNIPGGGWMTRMEFAADGTAVGRYDVHEGQYRKPGDKSWTNFLRQGDNWDWFTQALDIPSNKPSTGSGGHDAAVCWSNSNYMALIAWGYLWLTTNGGNTVTRNTAFGELGAEYDGNYKEGAGDLGGSRLLYKRFQFDPQNPQGMAFADWKLGLKYTINSGTSWSANASVPAPINPFGAEIMYDRSSALLNGRSSRVLFYSGGNGLYESTTGVEGTFSLISGSPTKSSCFWIAPNGDVWMIDIPAPEAPNGQGTLKRYRSGSWITTSVTNAHKVCVDPNNSDRVYVTLQSGQPICSTNGTAGSPTFSAVALNTREALDAPWLTYVPGGDYMSNGSPNVHPITGDLWTSEGLGFWRLPTPHTAIPTGTVKWIWAGQGNYTLIGSDVKIRPDGTVHAAHQDKSLFIVPRADVKTNMKAATKLLPYPNTSLRSCSNTDYLLSDPLKIAWVVYNDRCGTSSDGGVTEKYMLANQIETALGMTPGAFYGTGNIVLTGEDRGAVVPSINQPPFWFEPNGSGGFNIGHFDSGIAGVNTSWRSQSYPKHNGYYLSRQCLIADKLNPGTIYFYVIGDGSGNAADLAARGIWKSTNHGKNWSKIRDGFIIGYAYDFWNGRFKQPLTTAGCFFWHCGDTANSSADVWDPDPSSKLYVSTDNMLTWTAITAFTEVRSYGFGHVEPGHNFPTIRLYAIGGPAGYGLYECTNFNPASPNAGTWTKITALLDKTVELPADMEGDPQLPGRWYYPTGTGYQVHRFLHRANCI